MMRRIESKRVEMASVYAGAIALLTELPGTFPLDVAGEPTIATVRRAVCVAWMVAGEVQLFREQADQMTARYRAHWREGV